MSKKLRLDCMEAVATQGTACRRCPFVNCYVHPSKQNVSRETQKASEYVKPVSQ